MLKIAFRIDISGSIGTGHYMRMSVLGDAFKKLGCTCDFYKGEDEPVDYSGYDIIVIDTYEVDDAYIAALRKQPKILVCYDDNALYTYNCDILINANFHAKDLNFKFAGVPPKMLIGPDYSLLRREFGESTPITVRESANSIFVCFGGSDIRRFTSFAVCALAAIENISLYVVLGAYTRCDEKVYKLESDKVKIIKNPESVYEIMRNCDIAVTASGSMIYELASIGLPSIVISQADNQNLIAEHLSCNNLMNFAGDYKSVTAESLRYEAERLLNNFAERKEKHLKLISTVNKNGAMNAAKSILEVAYESFGKN